jgi:hypothetical protein
MAPWVRVRHRRRIEQGGVGPHECVEITVLRAEAVAASMQAGRQATARTRSSVRFRCYAEDQRMKGAWQTDSITIQRIVRHC